MAVTTEITQFNASALSQAIHSKHFSCVEVMQAYLQHIGNINPIYNAIVSLREQDTLLAEAKAHDELLAQGKSKGWLHGIPQAIKDLVNTKGLTTTQGSPLMRNFIPAEDALMVQRMKAAGAIVIGKTNVPEFGLGSHTFNEVFGSTKNAFDVTKTAGGSSGGASVALAKHMLPVADGSDFMGSLRNPAGWNHIYGMRPSQGRVPSWPSTDVWTSQLSTDGPMARTVEDLSRMLHTQSGYDARQPLSIQENFDLAYALSPMSSIEIQKTRILWLGNLDGYLPIEDGILQTCERTLKMFSDKGCVVETLQNRSALGFHPERVWDAWLVWRKALVASRLSALFLDPKNRRLIKTEAAYEFDSAQDLTGSAFMAASAMRTNYYQALLKLFATYDAIALPSAQVWPFDVSMRYPTEIKTTHGTVKMDTYHRWMESSIYATFAGLPCICIPAGFGENGLAMGLQLIGRPQNDAGLLRLAGV